MKVVINAKKATVPFSKLECGQCFLYDGGLWVKVATSTGSQPYAQNIGSNRTASFHPVREVMTVETVTATQ